MGYEYQFIPATEQNKAGNVDTSNSNISFLTCIQVNKLIDLSGEKQIIGNLAFEEKDSIIYLRELWVDKSEQKHGIGSRLINELETYASNKGCQGIVVTALIKEEEKYNFLKFMLRNQYVMPDCQERIVDMELDSYSESYLGKMKEIKTKYKAYPLMELPSRLHYDYSRRIRPNVMPACTLEQTKGKEIPELCIALASEETIQSYVIFSELEGVLYLSAVYLKQENAKELLILLQYCMKWVQQKPERWKTLRITLANQVSYHLFSALCRGAKVQIQNVYYTYKLL